MPIILLIIFFLSACSDDVYYDDDKAVHQKDCIGEIDYKNNEAEIFCQGAVKDWGWRINKSDTCLVELVLKDYFGDEFTKETNICQEEE